MLGSGENRTGKSVVFTVKNIAQLTKASSALTMTAGRLKTQPASKNSRNVGMLIIAKNLLKVRDGLSSADGIILHPKRKQRSLPRRAFAAEFAKVMTTMAKAGTSIIAMPRATFEAFYAVSAT